MINVGVGAQHALKKAADPPITVRTMPATTLQPGISSDVLENLPDAMTLSTAVRDENGRPVDLRLEYLNAQARASQPDHAHAVGRLISEFWPATVENGSFAACLRVLETGVAESGEFIWADEETLLPAGYEYRAVRVGADTLLWVLRDATQRLRQAHALAASEERFRSSFEHSPIGESLVALDGTWLAVNDALCRIVGYSEQELRQLTFQDITHPDDLDADLALFDRLLAGAIPSYQLEKRYLRKDGSVVWIELTVSLVRDARGQPLHAISQIRDVSALRAAEAERVTLEQRLHDSERRESLGNLAGGIAHDFNNLLAGVVGNAELLRAELGDAGQIALAEQIELAGRRAAELTQQMLAYSGQGKFVVETVCLADAIRELLPLLGSVISKKAELVLDCDDASTVRADATQLRQIAMNLITNASEAFGDGSGTITIRVAQLDADEEQLLHYTSSTPLTPGPYVALSVSDTGRGMDWTTQQRIFDPYFSTKFTGRGLGLASVLGIVEGHRGGLRIETAPGEGTRFTVLLPASVDEVPAAPASSAAEAPQALVVLVADDEELVRTLSRRMLELCGHTVVEAADGTEAVRLFTEAPDRFDCAVVDLVMPGYSGDEVRTHLRELRPELPVVIASGYNAQEVSTRFGVGDATAFLQKPFKREDLLAAIARASAPAPLPLAS